MKRVLTLALALLAAACKDEPTAPQLAALTLTNAVVNNNGGSSAAAAWTLSANGPTPLTGPGSAVSGPGFTAGTYTLSAVGPAGYTASAWSCTEGGLSGNTLVLAGGDTATCAITHNDTPPSLQVVKMITNDNGGIAQPSDFVVSAQGPTPLTSPGSVASDETFQQGTYTLSESGPSGYTASAWNCTGATVTGGNQVTLTIGQTATCTITNNDNTSSGGATLYVDNPGDFIITDDQAPAGLSNGDVVTFSPSQGNHTAVTGLTFGVSAFGTIQSAVNAALAGDRIRVAGGTFAEGVSVNKSLVLRGNQFGSDARQRAGTAGETVVTGVNNNGVTPFNITASDVTIDGFSIQGATNANQFGTGIVLGAGTAGTALRNNIVENNISGVFVANNSATNWTVIERNVFRTNNQAGPITGTAIYSDQFVAGGALLSVLIDNNSFANNSGAAIQIASTSAASAASNIVISRNQFSANGQALVAFNVLSSRFTGNETSNSTGTDLIVSSGVNNLTITHNILAGGGVSPRALRVIDLAGGGATNVIFQRNSISGYSIAGLVIDAGTYTGTLNAESNWWGAATGPTIPSNPGGTGLAIVDPNTQVDFLPFLTSGVDSQPGVPGFQPP